MHLEDIGDFSQPPKSVEVRDPIYVRADDSDDLLKSREGLLSLRVEDAGRVVFQVSDLNECELHVQNVLTSRSGTDVLVKDENLVRLHSGLPPRPRFEIRSSEAESFIFSAGHYFHGIVDLRLDALKSLESPPLRRVRHDSNVRHSKRVRLHGRETKEHYVTGPRV